MARPALLTHKSISKRRFEPPHAQRSARLVPRQIAPLRTLIGPESLLQALIRRAWQTPEAPSLYRPLRLFRRRAALRAAIRSFSALEMKWRRARISCMMPDRWTSF